MITNEQRLWAEAVFSSEEQTARTLASINAARTEIAEKRTEIAEKLRVLQHVAGQRCPIKIDSVFRCSSKSIKQNKYAIAVRCEGHESGSWTLVGKVVKKDGTPIARAKAHGGVKYISVTSTDWTAGHIAVIKEP